MLFIPAGPAVPVTVTVTVIVTLNNDSDDVRVAVIKTKSSSQHLTPLCDTLKAHYKQTKDFYQSPAKGAPFCNRPSQNPPSPDKILSTI